MPKGRFFAQPDDLTRIDFNDGPLAGEWMKVRTRLSFAESQRLAGGAVTGLRNEKKDDGETQQVIEMQVGDYQLGVIRFWVKRWSLEGDPEKGQHPSADGLTALLPEYASQIIAAIEAHEASIVEPEVATDPKPATGSTRKTAPQTGA